MNEELDSRWYTISRFLPDDIDIEPLLKLLKHTDWQVRLNAARVIRFQPDARTLDDLLALFKREKHSAVKHMVALALGALHESGVEVPLFADLKNPTVETRRDLALKRLKELNVDVSTKHDEYDQLMIPHKLVSACFIEIGFLIAQLADFSFPEHYAPLADNVPSTVLPMWSNPSIEFVESYPHGMKFRIYRQPR